MEKIKGWVEKHFIYVWENVLVFSSNIRSELKLKDKSVTYAALVLYLWPLLALLGFLLVMTVAAASLAVVIAITECVWYVINKWRK